MIPIPRLLALMNIKSLSLLFFCGLLSTTIAWTQIKVTLPMERAIFQRDNGNKAFFNIGGYYTQPIDKVEARLIPVIQGQGIGTDWVVIQTNPKNGVFFGRLSASGGWYTLEVRGSLGTNIIARDAVSRMGVGEVFLIAGDSNAEGIYNYNAPASTDDRVNCITSSNRETTSTADPAAITIGRITTDGVIGPRGRGAWCWGALGDRLAFKLNVPILFMNIAWEGTSLKNWTDSATNPSGITTSPINSFGYPPGYPYNNFKIAMRYYANTLGLRAVLWQQHEGDVHSNTTAANYQNSLQLLINLVRGEIQGSGGANDYLYVPFLITRTSRMTQWYNPSQNLSPQIIQAQNSIINTIFNKIYPGPEVDNIQVPRPDGVHFQGTGLGDLARAWDDVMLPQFFAATVPLLPKPSASITVTCSADNSSLQLQAPPGYTSYKWQNGNISANFTATTIGTYNVTMKDALGATVQTPPITISEGIQPTVPVISPNGEQLVCIDSTLALNVNVSASNSVLWSDGQIGTTARMKKDGSYSAKIVNMWGCSSFNSAPVTVKTLVMKNPIIEQSGPYSLTAKPDSVIFKFKDVTVKNIFWDWRQGTRDLSTKNEFLKVTQDALYSTRLRVNFESAKVGGSARTCPTAFSTAFKYTLPATDEGVIIFPNPNRTGNVTLETLRDLTNVEIIITDLLGQVVFEYKIPLLDERKTISLVNLREGSYLFRLKSSGFNQTKRFIIDY
jgi:Carbohydrate esterase, sialic acid-specific acetylesterase/Secretion system C-terminal sorting domain